ncbi:MAG: hypothetical protein ACAI44_23790, partial [Candidatus Sericytochromatia bacterium]
GVVSGLHSGWGSSFETGRLYGFWKGFASMLRPKLGIFSPEFKILPLNHSGNFHKLALFFFKQHFFPEKLFFLNIEFLHFTRSRQLRTFPMKRAERSSL